MVLSSISKSATSPPIHMHSVLFRFIIDLHNSHSNDSIKSFQFKDRLFPLVNVCVRQVSLWSRLTNLDNRFFASSAGGRGIVLVQKVYSETKVIAKVILFIVNVICANFVVVFASRYHFFLP